MVAARSRARQSTPRNEARWTLKCTNRKPPLWTDAPAVLIEAHAATRWPTHADCSFRRMTENETEKEREREREEREREL